MMDGNFSLATTKREGYAGNEALRIAHLNSILIEKVPGNPEYDNYLNQLKNEGWLSSEFRSGAGVVNNEGLLITVNDHERTTRKILTDENVSLNKGDNSKLIFINRGGYLIVSYEGNNLILAQEFNPNDQRLLTAIKYAAKDLGLYKEIWIEMRDGSTVRYIKNDLIKNHFDLTICKTTRTNSIY